MEVTFWGTRGSIPVSGPRYVEFGGNTPCLQISLESTTDTVIFDSGSGVRELGVRLIQTKAMHSRTVHLFLTHAHWDHIQGFPFFAPAFLPDFRLNIRCTKDAKSILERQMQTPFFPVSLEMMAAVRTFQQLHADDVVAIGEATVRHIPLPHPQESTAFRVDGHGKSIVFATDTEHAPDHINESLKELARDADVLIYDAQYTTEEYCAGSRAGVTAPSPRPSSSPARPTSRSSSSTATTPATTTRCCARSRPPPRSTGPTRSPPATACASSCEPRARAVSRAPAPCAARPRCEPRAHAVSRAPAPCAALAQ